MNALSTNSTSPSSGRHPARGFTLIEILIVVTILGTLAGITVPQFSTAAGDAATASTARQLQTLRVQIELYRLEQNFNPDLLGNQWVDLVGGDYLANTPVNFLNGSSLIAAAPGAGVGWVWRDKGNGTLMLFATDETSLAEWSE